MAEVVKIRIRLDTRDSVETPARVFNQADTEVVDYTFPITTMDAIETLEHRIRSDLNFKKKLVIEINYFYILF